MKYMDKGAYNRATLMSGQFGISVIMLVSVVDTTDDHSSRVLQVVDIQISTEKPRLHYLVRQLQYQRRSSGMRAPYRAVRKRPV